MSAARSLVVPASALVRVEQPPLLPVASELAGLFPLGGLRRGTTIVVDGSTAVLMKLLAEATVGGSWAAVVGMPGLGLQAVAELGVVVDRLAMVPRPGVDVGGVIAALLDGMDLVVVDPGSRGGPAPQLARRLAARARSRGSVLIVRGRWPVADLELRCGASTWSGLGQGHGYLRSRQLTVAAHGRGAASRPVRAELTLP